MFLSFLVRRKISVKRLERATFSVENKNPFSVCLCFYRYNRWILISSNISFVKKGSFNRSKWLIYVRRKSELLSLEKIPHFFLCLLFIFVFAKFVSLWLILFWLKIHYDLKYNKCLLICFAKFYIKIWSTVSFIFSLFFISSLHVHFDFIFLECDENFR